MTGHIRSSVYDDLGIHGKTSFPGQFKNIKRYHGYGRVCYDNVINPIAVYSYTVSTFDSGLILCLDQTHYK